MLENIDLSLVNWSRGQFALTAIYHWIFVPLTLGLSFIIAIMETIYVRTGREEWKRMTKFWMTLFGINFAIGVATGIILEFEFGTSSKEMEQELPKALKNYKIVMVRGHGAFAIGDFLEEALQYSHILESIARIVYMTKMMGGDLAKIQKGMYSTW